MSAKAFERLNGSMEEELRAWLRTGKRPRPRGDADPLWRAFLELSGRRTWHASGPNPIAFSEILAWSQLMRWPLEPHHVRLLLGLDHVWLDDAMRRRGGGEDGKPEAVTRTSSGPITPAAFDVMFGGPPGGVR